MNASYSDLQAGFGPPPLPVSNPTLPKERWITVLLQTGPLLGVPVWWAHVSSMSGWDQLFMFFTVGFYMLAVGLPVSLIGWAIARAATSGFMRRQMLRSVGFQGIAALVVAAMSAWVTWISPEAFFVLAPVLSVCLVILEVLVVIVFTISAAAGKG